MEWLIESYEITLSWDYKKDLGYDAKVYKQGRIGKTVRIKILNIKLLE